MENVKLCAVFGENPDELVFGYDEEHYLCAQMKYRLVAAMQEAIEKGYTHFISTVEQGAPMWAAEACMAIKELGGDVRFTAAPESDGQAERWHPERRERFFTVLERADDVIESSDESIGTEYIINNSDYVIVVGDMTHTRLSEIAGRVRESGAKVRFV